MRHVIYAIGDVVTYARAIGAATALLVADVLDPADATEYVSRTGCR